ncbi:hypothetical protein TRVA0_051S00100 [Trichomonascus vanleenenianus]|uniref:uncharacterized protein n=1 Tax=Trichomonascus vanleenenianus TaxID=2268995 RepID=UPI003ECA008A
MISDNEKGSPELSPEVAVFEHDDDQYSIPLEEYVYQARLTREYEARPENKIATNSSAIPFVGVFKHFFGKKKEDNNSTVVSQSPTFQNISDEKEEGDLMSSNIAQASRVLRNATWMSVFYLITTDILGPTSAPYAISQLGFVPGSLIFFLLGIAAAYTGYILWRQFLALDSYRYPLNNYGDIVGRIFGKNVRYGVDFLQALQLLCNVAVIILGHGNGLSQMVKGRSCYAVLVLVWALAGMVVGQIKTLQKFGFLANLAIWMNLFVCFATMGLAAEYGPNLKDASKSNGVPIGPIITKAVISGNGNFIGQLEATMNIVYSYGGAMMFIEFMSEMRRPWDFWKAMVVAQTIIFVVYLWYGLFVYAYQGQFVMNPAHQGIANYDWQTVCNSLNLATGIIAACLYGNVGIKVVYNTFARRVFRLPSLESKFGRYIWFIMVIVYWGVAYVIAAAIPKFSTLTSLVGAVCILQFTYTFPPAMAFGLDMQLCAMKADGPYNPVTREVSRIDTWKDASRWVRAFKDKWLLHTFHIIFFLASLTTAILGIYASALDLKEAFGGDGPVKVVAFSCNSPVVG